jgi:hypothetical protein
VAQVRDCAQGTTAPRPPITEAGVYVFEDRVYKVVQARHGSGRLYAKILAPPEEVGARAKWEYAKGAIYRLSSVDKITAEQAAEFGALYGVCCNCGLPLTREESIKNGYGPTCAEKHGWPYDHSN